jgi:phosphate transport system permease protein
MTGSIDQAFLLRKRKAAETRFRWLCTAATFIGLALLAVLIISVMRDGLGRLNPKFFTDFPSRFAEKAGFYSAIVGSLWIIVLTAVMAVPIGVAAAVYLEEFAPRTRFTAFIQTNIANLAGVPSIVYGLLGLAVFVRWMSLDRSVFSGALTMTLLILPTVILASEEALKAVPRSLREGSLALGATPTQTAWRQTLPAASSGILTGIILSLSRALGETAPLVTIGAMSYVAFTPKGLGDKFTVMPIQIFTWAARPQKGFQATAAAGILVLLCVVLLINGTAILLRMRSQRAAESM